MSDEPNDDYINNLNKSTKYRNDLVYVNGIYGKIESFDPETLQNINGGLVGFYGVTGCGKSILLKEIVYKNQKKYPGGIYLMCKTASLQPGYSYIPEANRMDRYSETFMINLWTKTTQDYHQQKNKKILVIMDDFIADPEFIKSKIIKDYAIGARHIGITVIMLTQYFCSLANIIRTNMRLSVCFKTSCETERVKFATTYLSAKNKKIGEILFDKITKEREYQCIVIENYKNDPDETKVIKKFLANPNLPKFKIKEYPAIKYLQDPAPDNYVSGSEASGCVASWNLPSCEQEQVIISKGSMNNGVPKEPSTTYLSKLLPSCGNGSDYYSSGY